MELKIAFKQKKKKEKKKKKKTILHRDFFFFLLFFCQKTEIHPKSVLLNESGHLEIPTGTLLDNRTLLRNVHHYRKSTSLIQSAEGSTTLELKNEITHFTLT